MPEDAGGEESITSSKKNGGKDSVAKDEHPPMDNIALAALLRKSAQIVEERRFAAILYQTLLDFRLYYKQKYPKAKRKKSNKRKAKKKVGTVDSHASCNGETETDTDTAAVVSNPSFLGSITRISRGMSPPRLSVTLRRIFLYFKPCFPPEVEGV
jgi:hypothetical protein